MAAVEGCLLESFRLRVSDSESYFMHVNWGKIFGTLIVGKLERTGTLDCRFTMLITSSILNDVAISGAVTHCPKQPSTLQPVLGLIGGRP